MAYNGIRADGGDPGEFVNLTTYAPGRIAWSTLDIKGTPNRMARRAYAYYMTCLLQDKPVGSTRLTCEYCGQVMLSFRSDVDHVIARPTSAECNVILMHVGCNRGNKRDKSSAAMRALSSNLWEIGRGIQPPIRRVALDWDRSGVI